MPRLLDLFCCAGGAGMGYHRAGFDVVGVDIEPQPHYPFEFHQADAIEYLEQHGHEFDAIHASPPCRAHTLAQKLQGNDHVDLIPPTRAGLLSIGKPWVIENVPGAPLIDPLQLCGSQFGLKTYRHRLFELSFGYWELLPPCNHTHKTARLGLSPADDEFMHVVGHFPNVARGREAMEIDWMTRDELAQAIPPAYTEWIGRQIIDHLAVAA